MLTRRLGLGMAVAAVALIIGADRGGAQQPTQAGVTSAVNPTAQGVPPGLQAEVLRLGSNIARNERITTGPDGLTQILFNDGSNLSIGPAADMTIDEYTYNPDQGTGRMTMSLTRGVLQLTGGRIAATSDVTVNTPVGTAGIRGAVGLFSATPGGATTAAMVYGKQLTVTGQSGPPQTITKSNFAITIERPGAPASPPVFVTPQVLASLTAAVTPPSGSSGGTASAPTEQSVQQSGSGLTKVVTTTVTEGATFVPAVTTTSLTALISAIAQSVTQSQTISQEVQQTQQIQQQVAQSATTPVTAATLLSDLLSFFGGSINGTTSVQFAHIFGSQSSASGSVNGLSVSVATANGQTFSSLLGQQSGNVNVTINGTTLGFTLSTTAPNLRQMDSFPNSTQTLSATIAGTLFQLVLNNSLQSIRGTNTASGMVNGVPFTISVPSGSTFGHTKGTTNITFALNGTVIYQGQILKLNTGFKP